MPHRTTKHALTIVGALTALAGTAVLGASPALADSDVVAFAHGGIHPTPALAGRVIGAVDPGHHYTGQCWTKGDLVQDHGIPTPTGSGSSSSAAPPGMFPLCTSKATTRATSPTTAAVI
jgi:hypothetical protein